MFEFSLKKHERKSLFFYLLLLPQFDSHAEELGRSPVLSFIWERKAHLGRSTIRKKSKMVEEQTLCVNVTKQQIREKLKIKWRQVFISAEQ